MEIIRFDYSCKKYILIGSKNYSQAKTERNYYRTKSNTLEFDLYFFPRYYCVSESTRRLVSPLCSASNQNRKEQERKGTWEKEKLPCKDSKSDHHEIEMWGGVCATFNIAEYYPVTKQELYGIVILSFSLGCMSGYGR